MRYYAYNFETNQRETECVYYFFEKNIFGDIVGVYDEEGDKVLGFTYDAWGNVSITESSEISSLYEGYGTYLKKACIFRYRGYMYESSSGFYYLQTRFYDPAVGRFINADGQLNDGLVGYNMYAYCENNPVLYIDPTGNAPKWLKDKIKWFTENVAIPLETVVKKTLSEYDLTFSRGISVSASPGIFTFTGQIGLSIDTKGNVAIQGTFSGGFTGGSPGISGSIFQTLTNAPNIDKLNGMAYNLGGSVGVPVNGVPIVIGGDLNALIDDDENDVYYGITTTTGLGTPGEDFHITWGKTKTVPGTRFNIFDITESIFEKIMEW